MPTKEDQHLRIGLLGCGFFGRSLARGVRVQTGASIVAVSDADADTATSTAVEIGAEAATLDELLADCSLDGILVATPNALHAEHVIRCCDAGLNVFVEKPMALNPDDCAAMIDAARRSGSRLMVGHIMRTMPGIRRIADLIAAGGLGTLLDATGWLVRTVNRSVGPTDWWKYDSSRSGGELFHEIHVLDLLCWLLDPQEIAALGTRDHSSIVMRANDALITYELSPVSRRPQWGFVINGSDASAVFDMRTSSVSVIRDGHSEVSDLFDDDTSNQSLRETAERPSAHNRAGAPTALWMQRAIEIEMTEAIRVFRGAQSSPLLDCPDRSVRVASAAVELMTSSAHRIG